MYVVGIFKRFVYLLDLVGFVGFIGFEVNVESGTGVIGITSAQNGAPVLGAIVGASRQTGWAVGFTVGGEDGFGVGGDVIVVAGGIVG